MIDQLPYQLTTGVTATREGLRVTDWRIHEIVDDRAWPDNIIPWPTAAERLRYREGEPWCVAQSSPELACGVEWLEDWDDLPRLHRLAAILCDDAEAFRVLHWCITNLGAKYGQ